MKLADLLPSAVASLVTLAVILLLRRGLPRGDQRGRAPLLAAAGSVLALLLVVIARFTGSARLEGVADFAHDLLFALGVVGAVDIFAFDLVLERLRVRVPRIVRDLLEAATFLFILFALLGSRGVEVLPLVTTSAVLTAVIGLALQSTLSNVFAGLALQLDRAFAVGHWIRVGERVGRVQQIRWRSTTLTTLDGDLLILPNGELTSREVLNLSAPTPTRRVRLEVGFDYRHPPEEVKRVLEQALAGLPGLLASPAPVVLPAAFHESAVAYSVYLWIDAPERAVFVEGEALTRIWYAARRAGLEIPYPQRVLHRRAPERSASIDQGERLALLESMDLFRALEPQDRQVLAGRMRQVRHAAGERILSQGDPGDSLFLVAEGTVDVLLQAAGGERKVASLGPRDFFGEMSLATGEPRAASCVARTAVESYVIDHAAFRALLEARPSLASEVSLVLARRASALSAEGEQLSGEAALKGAEERQRRLLSRIRTFFGLRE